MPAQHNDHAERIIPEPEHMSGSLPDYHDAAQQSSPSTHTMKRSIYSADPYSVRELCRTVMSTPHWDGKGVNWKEFIKEWNIFWSFQKELVGQGAKKWIFIKSLPANWQLHMKANITDHNWDFDQIKAFLDKQCDIMVPDWKKIQ